MHDCTDATTTIEMEVASSVEVTVVVEPESNKSLERS